MWRRPQRAHHGGFAGLVIFLVFWAHYCTLVASWIDALPALMELADALHAMGHEGVDLFFVLSGYLIYGSFMARQQAFIPFMARRVRRIYPAFIVVFVVYVVLSFAFNSESKIPQLLRTLGFTFCKTFFFYQAFFRSSP